MNPSRRYSSVTVSVGLVVFLFTVNPVHAGKKRIIIETIGRGSVVSEPEGIECPQQCKGKFPSENSVSLTATPSEGQAFVGWSGACAGMSEICVIELDRQPRRTSVVAAFTSSVTETPAPVKQTGQTLCVDAVGAIDCAATGQDGGLQAGVVLPTPRFTDNGDGTVTDNATGLHWLKDVGCLGNVSFTEAADVVTSLNFGTDFSCTDYLPGTFSDWRWSNINELHSTINFNFSNPAISNAQGNAKWSDDDPFVNFPHDPTAIIRSSTPLTQDHPNDASIYHLEPRNGEIVNAGGTSANAPIWPVRGPE